MDKFTKFQAEVIPELHPLFRGLSWVAAARSSDETRYVLNMIHIEREDMLLHAVATDGRRLHVHTFDPGLFDTDIELLPDGLYEVIAKGSKMLVLATPELDPGSYPNWRAVLPNFSRQKQKDETIHRQGISRIGIVTGALLAADFAMQAVGFGAGFKKDASVPVTLWSDGPDSPVVIEHELGKAVVMPLRQDNDSGDNPKSDTEATAHLTGIIPAPDADEDEDEEESSDEEETA